MRWKKGRRGSSSRAHHPLSEAAKVAFQVKEQIHAGGEQQHATSSALEGDQTENAPTAGRVCGSGHLATTIPVRPRLACRGAADELNMPRAYLNLGSNGNYGRLRRPSVEEERTTKAA
jgi:uncharacterized Zn-finger protein